MSDLDSTTLFLAGDVMLGRGVDQILGAPVEPRIHEPWIRDARDYVRLAEDASGPIPRGARPEYVWGELANELARVAPEARVVNLETSITRRGTPWPDKEVRYRVSPENAVGCLRAARIDACTLANNHVLDYDVEGLEDTLATLEQSGIASAGAGRDAERARRPARLALSGGGALVVLSVATDDCGVPWSWGARAEKPGVDLLEDFSPRAIDALCARVAALDARGDLVVVSIHWGSNWGYGVPDEHISLAHRLIDAGADLVHGHSSHHPRPIEVWRDRLILYGCGDLLNDYEGIHGHEEYRGELALAYFPKLERATGTLIELAAQPLRVRRMRLERAAPSDVEWLERSLGGACSRFGTRLVTEAGGVSEAGGRLSLRW